MNRFWLFIIRKLIVPCLLLTSLVLRTQPVQAAESALTQPAALNGGSLVQMFLALGVVIVLIVGLSIAVRKFNMFSVGASGHIRIVGGMALSNKDRLLLIQVGEEQLLISASPGRVSKIHEMSTPVQQEAATNQAGGGNFATLLNSISQRGRS